MDSTDKDKMYFTNKHFYIILISLSTSFQMFKDVHSQYAMMMKCKNPIYVVLAFFSTYANFYVCMAIMMTNLETEEILDIFMNFAGLFVVAEMDNIIAQFVVLYMPESQEDDFLEVDFDKETEKRADKIMMAQIWIYVIYNSCLMFCIKKVSADQN